MAKLPPQILKTVCEHLDFEDVCNFRLTNSDGVMIGESYLLRQRLIGFSNKCVDDINASAKHPTFGRLSRRMNTLVFDPSRLNNRFLGRADDFQKWRGHREFKDRFRMRFELNSLDLWKGMFSKERRFYKRRDQDYKDHLAAGRMDQYYANGFALSHQQFQWEKQTHTYDFMSWVVEIMLIMPRLKHIVIVPHPDLPTYGSDTVKGSPWLANLEHCILGKRNMQAGDCLEALVGLLTSLSVPPAERHLETITAIGISLNPFWEAQHTFVLAGAPAAKGLKSVRIQFDPEDIGIRSDRRNSDMEWLLEEFRHRGGYLCGRCRCRHKIHHFAELLQQATDLEELNVDTVRHSWGGHLPLPFIVANTYWRKLRKVSLGSCTATEAELKDFLLRHQDSLEVLQLRNSFITQGTWSSLFISIAGKLPKLRRVRFHGSLESWEELPLVEFNCSRRATRYSPAA